MSDRATTVCQERLLGRGENALPYLLRRHPRRRRITLLVTAEGRVELRVPPRTPVARAEAFLRQHQEWVAARLALLAERPLLADGCAVPLLDGQLILRLRGTAGGRVRQVGGELWLPAGAEAPQEQLAALLEGWYRRRARLHLGKRLNHWAARLGVDYQGLAIRQQKTRWGSCSSRGLISLNWRLLQTPAAVADYVVVHELCHRRHMDHSADFWAMVERHVPDCARHRQWLRGFRPPW